MSLKNTLFPTQDEPEMAVRISAKVSTLFGTKQPPLGAKRRWQPNYLISGYFARTSLTFLPFFFCRSLWITFRKNRVRVCEGKSLIDRTARRLMADCRTLANYCSVVEDSFTEVRGITGLLIDPLAGFSDLCSWLRF